MAVRRRVKGWEIAVAAYLKVKIGGDLFSFIDSDGNGAFTEFGIDLMVKGDLGAQGAVLGNYEVFRPGFVRRRTRLRSRDQPALSERPTVGEWSESNGQGAGKQRGADQILACVISIALQWAFDSGFEIRERVSSTSMRTRTRTSTRTVGSMPSVLFVRVACQEPLGRSGS